MNHTVLVHPAERRFRCRDRASLLREMVAQGISGIPVGCRSGGCGVCRVHVDAGPYELGHMSRAHISAEDEANGVLLACQIRPTGDLEVTVLGERPLPAATINHSNHGGETS